MRRDHPPPVAADPTVEAALARYQEARTLLAERERELESAYHGASTALAPQAAARLAELGTAEHILHTAKEEKPPIHEYDPSAYCDTWTYALRPDGQVLHVYHHSGFDDREHRQVLPFTAFLAQHIQRSAATAERIYGRLKGIIAGQVEAVKDGAR
jgi:hypothetical protein